MKFVLGVKLPKSRVLWYWCGGGNPKFMDPTEAVKYDSAKEAWAVQRALINEGMGTFVIESLTQALKKYRRRMQLSR